MYLVSMAKRRLPEDDVLAEMLKTRTRKEIAAEYGVSPQAVSNAIGRGGITTPRRSSLPWDLASRDQDDTWAQYLRALRRYHSGNAREGDRTIAAARNWARLLLEGEQAVTYDPDRGFGLVDYADIPACPTPCIQPQP